MKRKYNPEAVYRRTASGKYVEIGYEFRGFLMDGIWLVQNGRQNMTCLIGLKEKVPIFALNYRLHELELCKQIQEKLRGRGLSLMDEARLCCDYFAGVAAKQGEV